MIFCLVGVLPRSMLVDHCWALFSDSVVYINVDGYRWERLDFVDLLKSPSCGRGARKEVGPVLSQVGHDDRIGAGS